MSQQRLSPCRTALRKACLVRRNPLQRMALSIGIRDALLAPMNANKNRHSMTYAGVFLALFFAVSAIAEQPVTHDVTAQFVNVGIGMEGFRATEVGGIILLRGRTTDRALAEQAA